MAIANLINSVEEDDVAHLEMNDSEIILMVQEAEEEEEQEEEQVELVETSKEEKLKSLAITASILDSWIPVDRVFHRRVRELQMSIRLDDTTQCTLDSFLASVDKFTQTSCLLQMRIISYKNIIFFAK
uniref:Uncharacterized protein n=1 Tax=Hyaloperonospora arabidopsidis (strain Emoy2) TaxID=559515 RepID=M4BK58_HYAAE